MQCQNRIGSLILFLGKAGDSLVEENTSLFFLLFYFSPLLIEEKVFGGTKGGNENLRLVLKWS